MRPSEGRQRDEIFRHVLLDERQAGIPHVSRSVLSLNETDQTGRRNGLAQVANRRLARVFAVRRESLLLLCMYKAWARKDRQEQ